MPTTGSPPRLFFACAPQDTKFAELITIKARSDRLPFAFDSFVEGRSDEVSWQHECRRRIKRARAVVVLVSPHTRSSRRAMWQVKCARELGNPVVGITVSFDELDDRGRGELLDAGSVVGWKWKNIAAMLLRLAVDQGLERTRDISEDSTAAVPVEAHASHPTPANSAA